MEANPMGSHFSNLLSFLLILSTSFVPISSVAHEILKGFSATPNPSTPTFQPLLTDPTTLFSFGFLRVDSSRLALSILHLPSSRPLWRADISTTPPMWAPYTHLSFNGSLLLSDPHLGVFWSTNSTNGAEGDRLRLLNSSNLQILDSATANVIWQSFDFPSDTLVQNQNFTSAMALQSSNGLYSMRVLHDYLGLYADFKGMPDQIYWKRTAMEAKAQIEDGLGPIYARVDPDGFLGLYQTEKAPVDVMAFTSFHRGVAGFRILRLDSDGNIRGHFWNSTSWVLEFEAIQDSCEFPSACGRYGLCWPGKGCSCLDNRTAFSAPGGCSGPESGDLCGGKEGAFRVLRRTGVELPHKELMGFEKVGSLEECEGPCMTNCSCWGAVFSNVSGFCYRIGYPIQTLVGVGDGTKVGVFKVERAGEAKGEVGIGAAGLVLVIGGVGAAIGVVGFVVWFWRWRRRREIDGVERDGLSTGPYRDLKKSLRTDSFGSVELCQR